MDLVKNDNKFLEDLYFVDFEWLPDLEEGRLEYHINNYEDPYEFTTKGRHIIRIEFMDAIIPRIPESIASLTHLEEIVFDNNWFEEFPMEIFKIPNLKRVGSYGNRYPKFEFGFSTSLRELSISDNFDSLPESIGRLSNLTSLSISSNLTTLPESIGTLSKLKHLYLRNKLTTLPNSFKNLKKLEYLCLIRNSFTSLPKSIGQLTSLKELVIRENNISSLPDSLGGCSSLRVILAQNNKLSTVPATLGKLKKLRTLNLANNPITTLPETLGQLKNLKKLILNSCKLQELPITITKMKSLRHLELKSNHLTAIPDSIRNLASLEFLDLKNNKFTELPVELRSLLSLDYLNLQMNPLPRSFRRDYVRACIKLILMANNLKDDIDIENVLIEAIEEDLYVVFRALIGSGILNNVNEATIKKIVLKAFEKGDLYFVRYIIKERFALLFKEGELKWFIIDEKASLRKSLASATFERRVIPIVRYFLTNLGVSKDEIKDLLLKLGID